MLESFRNATNFVIVPVLLQLSFDKLDKYKYMINAIIFPNFNLTCCREF